MKILLASNNPHKLDEFRRLFTGHTLVIPQELGIAFEVPEEGTSFLDNALLKARALWAQTGEPVLADDAGLCVTALGGEPGVHSARSGMTDGAGPLTAMERNALLLNNMQGLADRRAYFVCCLVLLLPGYRLFVAQDTLEGVITGEARGNKGFGYDPVFFLPEPGKTVAELSDEQKDSLSHRGRAARSLLCLLGTVRQ